MSLRRSWFSLPLMQWQYEQVSTILNWILKNEGKVLKEKTYVKLSTKVTPIILGKVFYHISIWSGWVQVQGILY